MPKKPPTPMKSCQISLNLGQKVLPKSFKKWAPSLSFLRGCLILRKWPKNLYLDLGRKVKSVQKSKKSHYDIDQGDLFKIWAYHFLNIKWFLTFASTIYFSPRSLFREEGHFQKIKKPPYKKFTVTLSIKSIKAQAHDPLQDPFHSHLHPHTFI